MSNTAVKIQTTQIETVVASDKVCCRITYVMPPKQLQQNKPTKQEKRKTRAPALAPGGGRAQGSGRGQGNGNVKGD